MSMEGLELSLLAGRDIASGLVVRSDIQRQAPGVVGHNQYGYKTKKLKDGRSSVKLCLQSQILNLTMQQII